MSKVTLQDGRIVEVLAVKTLVQYEDGLQNEVYLDPDGKEVKQFYYHASDNPKASND